MTSFAKLFIIMGIVSLIGITLTSFLSNVSAGITFYGTTANQIGALTEIISIAFILAVIAYLSQSIPEENI